MIGLPKREPEVGVVGVRELPQRLGIVRVGDVERVVAASAGIEPADEDGLPGAVDVDVAHLRRAVHVVLVVVRVPGRRPACRGWESPSTGCRPTSRCRRSGRRRAACRRSRRHRRCPASSGPTSSTCLLPRARRPGRIVVLGVLEPWRTDEERRAVDDVAQAAVAGAVVGMFRSEQIGHEIAALVGLGLVGDQAALQRRAAAVHAGLVAEVVEVAEQAIGRQMAYGEGRCSQRCRWLEVVDLARLRDEIATSRAGWPPSSLARPKSCPVGVDREAFHVADPLGRCELGDEHIVVPCHRLQRAGRGGGGRTDDLAGSSATRCSGHRSAGWGRRR